MFIYGMDERIILKFQNILREGKNQPFTFRKYRRYSKKCKRIIQHWLNRNDHRYNILYLGLIHHRIYGGSLVISLKWGKQYYGEYIKFCSNPQNCPYTLCKNKNKVIRELKFRGFKEINISELPKHKYFIMSNFDISPKSRLVYLDISFDKYYKSNEKNIYYELGYLGFPGYTQIDLRLL